MAQGSPAGSIFNFINDYLRRAAAQGSEPGGVVQVDGDTFTVTQDSDSAITLSWVEVKIKISILMGIFNVNVPVHTLGNFITYDPVSGLYHLESSLGPCNLTPVLFPTPIPLCQYYHRDLAVFERVLKVLLDTVIYVHYYKRGHLSHHHFASHTPNGQDVDMLAAAPKRQVRDDDDEFEHWHT